MKIVQKIISIVLVLTLLNVLFSKAFHEIFEHDHEIKECELSGVTHFHEIEVDNIDLICNFNFSAGILYSIKANFGGILRYQEGKVRIQFLWLAKNLCCRSISLRGPPSII